MTPTRSEQLGLNAVRDGVLHRPGLRCLDLREALTEAYDHWLQGLLPDRPGLALAGVGGYGRGDLAPGSDLDLVLLHNGKIAGLNDIADGIWYPVWDSGVSLDHSVRTPAQAEEVADDDIRAMLGMLEIRHVAGDESLTASVRSAIRDRWRRTAPERFVELQQAALARGQQSGEGAFLLEPNIKESRGGIRDAQALYALALAQLVDVPPAVRRAHADLLDVRGELHRVAGRAEDVLRQEDQDGVALALEWLDDDGSPDRDAVLLQVNSAARLIAHTLDAAWRRVRPTPRRRRFGRDVVRATRVGLAPDVVAQDGEVVLALDAEPPHDAGLVLRAARAAAENDLPLSDATLVRLKAEAAPVDIPWPAQVRDDFVALLGTGSPAVGVLESMDLAGLLEPLFPEWHLVRSKAQRNPVHTFTVDRHLLETAAMAARHARELDRPDLLLVGALLHDIGKGLPGDHSIVGEPVARTIAERMGFAAADLDVIGALVRHHLLLPDTATRRDPDDPATLRIVTDAVGDDHQLLDLLHCLAIADAAATGPAAWNDWKASLVAGLVRRVHLVQHGADPRDIPLPDNRTRELAGRGGLDVLVDTDPSTGSPRVTVVAPDRIGGLYRTAGVLALHLLDVRSAAMYVRDGSAISEFVVQPRFGSMPDPAALRAELLLVLQGEDGQLGERLREKERTYGRPSTGPSALLEPASVHWFDDEATDATVVEYRAPDAIGLLSRVTAVLERCELDVRCARVSSLAGSVVDSFYVTNRDGALISEQARPAVTAALLEA